MNVVTRVTIVSFGGAFGCFRPPVAPVSGLGSERKYKIDCVSTTDLQNILIMNQIKGMISIFMINFSFKRVLSLWRKCLLISWCYVYCCDASARKDDMSGAMLRSTISASGDVNARFRRVKSLLKSFFNRYLSIWCLSLTHYLKDKFMLTIIDLYIVRVLTLV